jgi:thiamine kinase
MPLSTVELVDLVPEWETAAELKLSFLPGGVTNENYRIDVDQTAYVLRVPGYGTAQLGIKRRDEYEAQSVAAEMGLAPAVIDFIRPEGYLLTQFLEGRALTSTEIIRPETIRKIAKMMRQLHSGPQIEASFSPFRLIEHCFRIAQSKRVSFPLNLAWFTAQLARIEAGLAAMPTPQTLCHNDLRAANFWQTADHLYLIDWELAGMGDPCFDLADLVVNQATSEETEQLLLTAYFDEVTPLHQARFNLLKLVASFKEIGWLQVQVAFEQLEFEARELIFERFSEIAQSFKQGDHERWLLALSQG